MNRSSITLVSMAVSVVASGLAVAQSTGMGSMDMKSTDPNDQAMKQQTTSASHKGAGIVKSVNAADGIVTLAHEPVKSLNWPAMTMSFKVRDKPLAGKLKPGDKVDFTFIRSGNDYVITGIK
ncbi:MAG: copper-binding protein [Betaproteobacteria bacterium]